MRDVTPLPDLLHGRSHTGPVRERRPVYVDLLPPCNAGCPAGENIQAWLSHTQAGRHEEAWRAARRRQPAARDPRAGLLPPVRERLQPRQPRQRRLDPFGRALPRRPRAGAGLAVPPTARAQRQAGARDRRRAQRALGRLPPGPARPRGRDPGRGRRAGRDDAVRHPLLPAAPRRLGRRARPDRGTGRADDLQPPGRGPRRRTGGGRLRRGLRRGRRPPVQAGRHPGAGRRPDRGRGVVPAQRRLGRAAGDRPARGGLRRRQHRDGRRPGRPPAGRRRGADRLPAHPRADAGTRGGGRGRRARRRADQLAAHDHGVRRPRGGMQRCRSR